MTNNIDPSALSVESHSSYQPKSAFLLELQQRGYIYQTTDLNNLDAEITTKGKIAAYVGFDCTARSLHVGSLMQIMLMRRLQQHGHQPIIIFGGATTMIGDPSDKQEMRKMLTVEEIEENKLSISKIFHKVLDCGSDNAPIIIDNKDWLGTIGYIEMLRQCGRHLSVNRMLSFDSVKLRLEREQSLSFLEFNYMVLQAYDFVELYRRYGCILQFGGSEQWGNIVSGIELGRKVEDAQLFGITTPLVTTSDGKKMGKTAKGAVWLNGDMLSPYDFWQFWRNTDDADVGRFLKLYTDLPVGECEMLGSLSGKDINQAKIILANEVTAICHGIEAAQLAEKTALDLFKVGIAGGDIPRYDIDMREFNDNISLYQLLVKCNLAKSNSSARQLIIGGGVRLDAVTYRDEKWKLDRNFMLENRTIKLWVGKKNCVIVNFV